MFKCYPDIFNYYSIRQEVPLEVTELIADVSLPILLILFGLSGQKMETCICFITTAWMVNSKRDQHQLSVLFTALQEYAGPMAKYLYRSRTIDK